VFVVIDNGGGGLFDLLPQAEHAPGFERLFVTPHGLDISRLAQTYGLGSVVVERVEGLAQSIATRIESRGAHVVVVPVERETELKQRRALDDTARVVCAGLS
jgi:2-succinyl-5-enolpyruvyl-6-hydroxy-3-cyclohexene-1-carboxylate synthase